MAVRWQYRANSVLRCVTTMIDKKRLTKLLSFMSTFDGGLYLNKHTRSANSQFIMNMRTENLDYITWVKETLENITGVSLYERGDYNTDGCNRSPQTRLESRHHPFLTTLMGRIYINGKKVIDPHMLKLMDAEALAIMFMADGGTREGSLDIYSCGFSYADNMSLSKAIYDKLGITTNVRKHGTYWKLAFPVKSITPAIRCILPYVCDSFLYKIERLTPLLEKKEGGDIVCTLRERREGTLTGTLKGTNPLITMT